MTKKDEARANAFNALYPVGTTVRYWTMLREGEGKLGKIKYPAQEMCGRLVVYIDEGVGAVSLTHVAPDRG